MKEVKVIARFRINGVYYTMEELPKETVSEIVKERVTRGMKALNYERKSS